MSDASDPKNNAAELERAIALLERVSADRSAIADVSRDWRERLQKVCGEIARPDLKQRKRLQRALYKKQQDERRAHDEALRDSTAIRQLRKVTQFPTPLPPIEDGVTPVLSAGLLSSGTHDPPAEPRASDPRADPHAPDPRATHGRAFHEARNCYVCKRAYTELHAFYDQLCPECAAINFKKRTQVADLRGRVCVITGARVKIGYQAAILMLRAGCTVVACTRFPVDAAARYAREADFAQWRDRLHVYGIDLRHTPSVDRLARHLADTLPRLDFQIHNACQTVRRPPGFYTHLVDAEHRALSEIAPAQRALLEGDRELRARGSERALTPAQLTQIESDADRLLPVDAQTAAIFPVGALDQDLQQVDLRSHNSWRLALDEVPTLELLEVMLVNAAAPFVMASKLKPLMLKSTPAPSGSSTSSDDARHIVMVSAMEGQFYRGHKTDKHPHTNAAKAALNMTVRTSASDYARDRIYMNAVDTGWVTDEDPAHIAAMKVEEHAFSPPLDIVDGAARIVDPILDGFNTGNHRYGLFLKDYVPVRW